MCNVQLHQQQILLGQISSANPIPDNMSHFIS